MNLFGGFKDEVKEESRTGSVSSVAGNEERDLHPGDDESFMSKALKLAKLGECTTHPNPAVGCIVVSENRIVGEGWHRFAGDDHAEVEALRNAGKLSQGATMYVTLEPCSHQGKTPPCVKAIIKSGVRRVVIATEDPNPLVNRNGISELQRAGLDVMVGPCHEEAKRINRGFLKRITLGVPWVTLKIATSLDGKIAMASGESQWITEEPARRDAQMLRARSSGILTGVGTVLRDDPNMNVRLEGTQRQPLRVIVDTNLSTPPDSNILKRDGNVLIVTSGADNSDMEQFDRDSVEVLDCPAAHGQIDLDEMMLELGRREMNSILLEAGAKLSGSMLARGLVDEMVVYMSPDLLGSDARDMFRIPGLEQISDRIRLEYRDVVRIGRDMRLTLSVTND